MRNWKGKLYLGPMPGLEEPFSRWLEQLETIGIHRVVCLNPSDEIDRLSPEYAAWRKDASAGNPSVGHVPHLIDIPITDGSIPDEAQTDHFWSGAALVASAIDIGERVLIHCTAGRGRTGTFATAVLMTKGYSLVDAATEIYEVGSYAETSEQESFLESAAERFSGRSSLR